MMLGISITEAVTAGIVYFVVGALGGGRMAQWIGAGVVLLMGTRSDFGSAIRGAMNGASGDAVDAQRANDGPFQA